MEIKKVKEVFCSKCGKSMTDEYGGDIIGVKIRIFAGDGFQAEFIKKQLGKYEPGKDYLFCYECLLDSLFGKQ